MAIEKKDDAKTPSRSERLAALDDHPRHRGPEVLPGYAVR